MNKLIIFVSLIIGVIGWYTIALYFNVSENNKHQVKSEKNVSEDDASILSHEKNIQKESKPQTVEVTEKIISLNESLSEKFRPNGSRKPYNFGELKKLAKSNHQRAVEMIKELASKPDKNLLALADLNYQCQGLLNAETKLNKILLNRPFEKAIWDSGYCSRLGTASDPFFDFLKLARSGDTAAQMILSDELYGAIERGSINTKTDPIFYNDLRNEVIGYLKSLSSQGVSIASLKLSREYLSDSLFFSTDIVLATYYLYLYENQHSGGFLDYPWDECFSESKYCKSPYELYNSLSDIEKDRVDRMLN